MPDVEGKKADGLEQYLSLARENPRWFANPSERGFVIVLDESEIRLTEKAKKDELQLEGLPGEWARVGVVYEDQYLLILRDAVRFPDGHRGTYLRIMMDKHGAAGVAVLPMRKSKVVLLSHFRHATREWHLEIPRGFHIPGSEPAENARIELEEETGSTATSLVSLGRMHVNTGMSSESVGLFYAEVESIGEPEAAEAIGELIEVELAEFERLIRDEEITDSFTITAYARAKLRGLV